MDTPLSSLFDFLSPQHNTDLDKSMDYRAGFAFTTPYILVTDTSTWQVPAHWKTQKVNVFLIGGGGSGGRYSQVYKAIGTTPAGNGGSTSITRQSQIIASAQGGLHGLSRLTIGTTPVTIPQGGGRGGESLIKPTQGSPPTSLPPTPFVQYGQGGMHGEITRSDSFSAIGGGGGAGIIPFGWTTPPRWNIPFPTSKDTRVKLSFSSIHAGKNGTGFGAGGGGSGPTKTAYIEDPLHVTFIGASGGGHGQFTQTSLSLSPSDTLSFVIGKGGKLLDSQNFLPGHGHQGAILITFPKIIEFFPTSLPQPNINAYTLAPENQVISSSMESGHQRKRQISLHNSHNISCSWTFSQQQYTSFAKWFQLNIQNGAKSFLITLMTPFGLQNVSARFSEPLRAQLVAHNLWTLQAQLQVIFIASSPSPE